MDTHLRSWTKAVSWRVTGIVLLAIIAYGVTRDVASTTLVTLIFHSLRLVLYYFHERIWERISWGRELHPLARIRLTRHPTPEELDHVLTVLRSRELVE